MINTTRFKVDEAIYFLSMMKQTYNENSDVFSFNLHAFLTSFRSITYYMQKQYSKCSGFPEWYCPNQIKMSSDPDLKFIRKIRDEVIHKQPANNTSKIEIRIPVSLPIIPGEDLFKKYYENDDLNKREIEVNKRRFFEKNKEIEIIEFCETQLNKIIELVDECELNFKL